MQELEDFIKLLQSKDFGIVWEIGTRGDSIVYKVQIIHWPTQKDMTIIRGDEMADVMNEIEAFCKQHTPKSPPSPQVLLAD